MRSWTSEHPWEPHQKALAEWAARRWGWSGGADWPSALALLVVAEDEGHTALAWGQATSVWARRFETDMPDLPPPSGWPRALFDEGWLVASPEGRVQTARNAALESQLLSGLAALVDPGQRPGLGQDEAVARASGRLMLLTGGPGTGKTTTLKRLVAERHRQRPGLRVAVAAPTGRAAARVEESFSGSDTGPVCLTLHRLLGLKPGLGQPWHGPHRPLPFDLVIVDEASMLDLRTAAALVAALGPQASLILVGDPDQLPSVEPGAVLADLLRHPLFRGSTVHLTQRYRLEASSQHLAQAFDWCAAPDEPEAVLDRWRALGARAGDFRWIETPEGADPGPEAMALMGAPRPVQRATLGEWIFLSPVHSGPGGTEALNGLVDRRMGRAPGTMAEGMPWMIERNLPHLSLQNGDRGVVTRSDGRLWFEVPGRDQKLPFSLVATEGVPAWAITVHKSQGSEFDRVVLVLPARVTPLVTRELVYTALTRARSTATIVGSAEVLRAALSTQIQRWSGPALSP